MKDMLNGILEFHTGQPLKRIKRDTDRDFFMSSKEAKEYGLIDEVVQRKAADAKSNEE
jgi:ATP-dependent Clp protease protease subunit